MEKLCGVANPGGVPCTKEKGHPAGHDDRSYGPELSSEVQDGWQHHKNCAVWTVTTGGDKKNCDCNSPDSIFKGSPLVQDVDRCVKCGHSGQVDRNGICRVNLNKSRTGLPDRCACKCEFPSPSVSTTWNHNRNCAIWTATTDGAKKPCDCAQVDSVFKGSVSEAEDKEAKAIETMIDRVQPDYPNLTREELREIFHATYERLAAEDKNSGEGRKEHRAVPSSGSQATSELKASLSFSDAVKIARGCHDYGGGHHSDGHMEAYQHGIQTVVQALEHAEKDGLQSYQIAVLHSIGSIQDANTAASAGTTEPD